MRILFPSLFLLVSLLAPGLPLSAAQPDDLFVDETTVDDESSEIRNAALSGLLSRVLVRVSGNAGIAGQPAASGVLEAAPSLVQQYRYRDAGQDDGASRVLWARFDQGAVERMMRERHLPVWSNRPSVLLWLAGERSGKRALINLENEPAAREAVSQRAAERGMPLQLPLMDLEDQAALSAADLWSGYQAGIRAASARYPAQAVLSGRLSALPGGKWRGDWELDSQSRTQGFQTPAQGLADTLGFAVDQAQNLLAARFAPMPGAGGAGGSLFAFSGVTDLAAYSRLLAALSEIEAISRKSLRHAEGGRVVFQLQSRGDAEALTRALEASGNFAVDLVPILGTDADPANVPDSAPDSTGAAPRIDYAYRLLR